MGPIFINVLTIAAIVLPEAELQCEIFRENKNPAKGQALNVHSFRRLSMESIQYWILLILHYSF